MVTINYQTFGTKGFQLRLRLYKDGETRYITVTKKLKGVILKKHWNASAQMFRATAPYHDVNNAFLMNFRARYEELAENWNGSVYGLIAAVDDAGGKDNALKLKDYISSIIDELKQKRHSDGSVKGTYEGYEKLLRRLQDFCLYKHIDLNKLLVTDVKPKFVDDMFDWVQNVRKGNGYVYISVMLHSVLMRADKDDYIDWNEFKRCKWKGKNKESAHKYNTLSMAQCRKFVSLTLNQLPKNPKSEFYHDFCTFILYTGQSVCDAVSLKYSDIKVIGGVEHFIFKRRKIAEKQGVPCAVPINPIMRSIMDKWRPQSRDEYIFPVRNKHKIKTQTTNNGDIKHLISRLNTWLKKIAPMIGCEFSLHTYVFRHTAITHYLSKDVPIIYVANLMGTSVKNCEKIYYNNLGDANSRDKVLGALTF